MNLPSHPLANFVESVEKEATIRVIEKDAGSAAPPGHDVAVGTLALDPCFSSHGPRLNAPPGSANSKMPGLTLISIRSPYGKIWLARSARPS